MEKEENNLIVLILSILIGFFSGFVLGLIGLVIGGLILYIFLELWGHHSKFYPMLFFLISGVIGIIVILAIILFKA
jgi:TctA family transporter